MGRTLPPDFSSDQRLREALREAWSDVEGAEFVRLLVLVRAETGRRARALRALELVQALPYTPDPPGLDVVQTASETAATGGDCEDKASLLVVLCVCAGVPAGLAWLSQERLVRDHVAAQVWLVDGARGVWAETTVDAYLGEPPHTAADRLRQTHTMGAVV